MNNPGGTVLCRPRCIASLDMPTILLCWTAVSLLGVIVLAVMIITATEDAGITDRSPTHAGPSRAIGSIPGMEARFQSEFSSAVIDLAARPQILREC